MRQEVKAHLVNDIIPFWRGLRDDTYGGYYGELDINLKLDKKAVKGVILHSRILWFFSNAYLCLKDESLLDEAKHTYDFLYNYCYDRANGGMFWSVNYDGSEADTTKHTYNQAFAVYALSSYFDASGCNEALELAKSLFSLIETKCRDEIGYLEAFDKYFHPEDNDKLSENGVMAEKTMNTLLHVYEAYSEFYRVLHKHNDGLAQKVGARLRWMMDEFLTKVYNPEKKRLEVFFDKNMNSIIDLHSYGHDIEASWLIDHGCDILGDDEYTKKIHVMTDVLAENVYNKAYHNNSLWNECECGKEDKTRVWWVQAEAILGFLNAYKKHPEEKKYLEAAEAEWEYIKEYIIDKRPGSEWLSEVDDEGRNTAKLKSIVELWKCPYHNGRMCMMTGC